MQKVQICNITQVTFVSHGLLFIFITFKIICKIYLFQLTKLWSDNYNGYSFIIMTQMVGNRQTNTQNTLQIISKNHSLKIFMVFK